MNYSDIEPLPDLKQNENLDLILGFYKTHAPSDYPKTAIPRMDELVRNLTETAFEMKIDAQGKHLFDFLRKKLIADELLEKSQQMNESPKYTVTASGIFFEGYVSVWNNNRAIVRRRERLEERQLELSEQTYLATFWMSVATVAIGIGTIFAAIYYLQRINWCFCH
jgi:hypothetical protein